MIACVARRSHVSLLFHFPNLISVFYFLFKFGKEKEGNLTDASLHSLALNDGLNN